MTVEEAIVKFERQLTSAMVVLDSGFGQNPGEHDRVYRERKEMAEIALDALRAQQEAEKKPMTNADHIRGLGDEGLVRFWSSTEHCGSVKPGECQKEEWDGNLSPCDQCLIAWLKQPYNGGETDG